MKIKYLILIAFLFTFLFMSFNNSNYAKTTENVENQSISTLAYQNQTIEFPSWENGEFLGTYTQYGELVLLVFETEGSWVSQTYTVNTAFIYYWETICNIPLNADLTLTVYLNYDETGWIPNSVPLNYTMNYFLNGDWEFFFVFNFTKGDDSPLLYNFSAYYIWDLPEISSPPYIFSNPIFEISLILIMFLFIVFIYMKMRSITLMTIAYLIYLPISVQSLWNLTIPFYPFVQLFLLCLGTYLFLDLVLKYRKQMEN